MNIGLIIKNESYWSLKKETESVLSCLRKKYKVYVLSLSDNAIKNQKHLDNLYKKCDAVIYMASKLASFKRIQDKPTLFFTHAWMDHGAGVNFYINKRTFYCNDILIFTSSGEKNKFNLVYKTNLRKAVVPYFVPSKKPKLGGAREELIREKYRILKGLKIIMYFGRFSKEKNIEALFEIAKKLKNRNFIILAVGKFTSESTFGFGKDGVGVYEKKIKNIIASDRLKKVIFINKISNRDLTKLLSVSFITINPTLCPEEDFSLSAVESMSIGVPVVASNWGGLKDIIRSGQDGFLADVKFSKIKGLYLDTNAAASYIDRLLSGKISREKLSKNAISRHEKIFSKTAFLKNINLLLAARKIGSKSKEVFLDPMPSFKKIYEKALKNKEVGTIYSDNPKLFQKLNKDYFRR